MQSKKHRREEETFDMKKVIDSLPNEIEILQKNTKMIEDLTQRVCNIENLLRDYCDLLNKKLDKAISKKDEEITYIS